MRDEIAHLVELDPLPAEQAPVEDFDRYEPALAVVTPPVTDEEARALVGLFGPDDCFGAAWTLVHLIETAPGWPLWDCLKDSSNPWVVLLRESAERAGYVPP